MTYLTAHKHANESQAAFDVRLAKKIAGWRRYHRRYERIRRARAGTRAGK